MFLSRVAKELRDLVVAVMFLRRLIKELREREVL
jgi:hypothetical protein